MDQFSNVAKVMVVTGAIILLLGILLMLFGKIPFLGKLPGDISIKGKNWSFYFPLATSILLSLIITLLLFLFKKFF